MSQVDWDLLADHLGGALAGTPAAARVAQLITSDPEWAAAAADLECALQAVAADLRTVPAAPGLPDDVAARLDAALLAAPPPAAPPAAVPAPVSPARFSRPGSAPPAAGPPGPPGPGRPTGPGRRAGRRRWAVGLATVAGALAFAAVGLGSVNLLQSAGDDEGATGGATSAEDAAVPPLAAEGAPQLTATGLEYTSDSPLLRTGIVGVPERAPGLDGAGSPQADAFLTEAPPPPLDRVWADPQPCLSAVRAEHGPEPVLVMRADFASFEGEPAVVVWLTTGDGGEWVWVAGPDCGAPPAGSDLRYRTELR